MQTGMRQPPIPPQVKSWDFLVCFGRITFLGFFFFLCSPSSSFFFPLSSLSVTFLYFLSFVFLPKRRRNGFWFKCRAPLPSSFFFFLLSSFFFLPSSSFFFLLLILPSSSFFLFSSQLSLSLYTFSLLFFFFFCLFGSSAGLHVMLLDICLKFLFHLHFGVLCTLFFSFLFFLSDISLGFIFIFLLYYSNTSA